MVKNKVQLITYPDSLGLNLKDLNFVLLNYFKEAVGGVHILPFYPSSGDRGFAPLTHLVVDEKFGTWEDIKEISKDFEVMVDFMMNHISLESKYFQDFLKKGYDSKYADMFLTYDKVFGDEYYKEDVEKIYRPRPTEPFMNVHLPGGIEKKVWITFSPDQIDLDWKSYATLDVMSKFLEKMKSSNISYLRLDAAGYTSKLAGTSCFFNQEAYEYIDWIKERVGDSIKLLPEVHYNYSLQLNIAQRSDLTYDFQLTILLLNAIYFGNTNYLKHWISIRPNNVVTVLDTHDGIGIIDAEELLPDDEIERTKEKLFEKGGNATMRATGMNSDNFDVYQINCTYFSAVGDEVLYLMARAVQFFLPGIPQVYYVGLLAGENDIDLLEKTNHGRDVNRHYYSLDEIERELRRDVVQKLISLMKFRNNYPAFNGDFVMLDSNNTTISLKWSFSGYDCILNADFALKQMIIKYSVFSNGKMEWKEIDIGNLNSIINYEDFHH